MNDISYHEAERNERIRAMRQRTGQLEREGTYWTDEEREKLKSLFFDNVGITDIALELQRTEVAISQQIQSLGLYEKVRRPYAARASNECLCGKCGRRRECERGGCSQGQGGTASWFFVYSPATLPY